MAKSLRNRILTWHILSLSIVAALLSGSFYFGLQQSRTREIDFEMEGAAQSLISLLRALPTFELKAETDGVPPEVLARRRELERERQRRLRDNPEAAAESSESDYESEPPFGLPRGPDESSVRCNSQLPLWNAIVVAKKYYLTSLYYAVMALGWPPAQMRLIR